MVAAACCLMLCICLNLNVSAATGLEESGDCGEDVIWEYYNVALDSEKHYWVETGRISATCEEDGEATYSCPFCNEEKLEKLNPTGHSYKSETIEEATCTEVGIRKYFCENCNDTYYESIPATGHSYGNGSVTTKATYTSEGIRTYTCKDCGQTKTEKIAKLTPPTKGTTFTVDKNTYKITKAGATGGTVAFTGTNPTAKSVSIPDTITVDGITYKVTSIANKALKNNKTITKVTIGNNITTIGKKSFYGCANLKKITIKSTKLTKKKTGANAFKGIKSTATIKVPTGKAAKYKKILQSKGIGAKVKVK